MNLKSKYNKVKILSKEGATEGEKQAAKEALKRMEEKHPELIRNPYISNQEVIEILKGYQSNITFDEASNLSDEVWRQTQEQLDYIFKKNGWTKTKGTWIK